jgi:hypothetical protein
MIPQTIFTTLCHDNVVKTFYYKGTYMYMVINIKNNNSQNYIYDNNCNYIGNICYSDFYYNAKLLLTEYVM